MMQGLIEKYDEMLDDTNDRWSCLGKRPQAGNNNQWYRLSGHLSGRIQLLKLIRKNLKETAVSVDAALDTSAAKLRRIEAGRLAWQARAERLQESLNEANSQIEDLQDAVDCGDRLNGYEFDEISIDEASADGTADAAGYIPILKTERDTLENAMDLIGYTITSIGTLEDEKVREFSAVHKARRRTSDAPRRDESGGGAGAGDAKARTHCPECASGKTAVNGGSAG